jgi:DUF1365 family protein
MHQGQETKLNQFLPLF